MKKIIKIVLIGQPNVGKSLLINALSGADMKVGNFSGVTVEKAQAKMSYKDYELEIIDLPGTYSLEGYSQEEKISKSFIESGEYDVLVNVLDSTNLERNLLLSAQLLEKTKNDFSSQYERWGKKKGFIPQSKIISWNTAI